MAKWTAKLIDPERAVRVALNRAVNFVYADLERWIRSDLVTALVYGGYGIQGLEQTPFYTFISSPDGLSQLGIEASEPPKLLSAYASTMRVVVKGYALEFGLGDRAILRLATKHPAAGTGFLDVSSWLEWVIDGEIVNRGFVDRSKLTSNAQKSIRLGQPLGGLMLPRGAFGSPGTWKFPAHLQDYESKWLAANASKIEEVVFNKLREFLSQRLNG